MQQADSVTQHLISIAQRRHGRLPAFGDSDRQQLFSAGPMIPHGDRRDGAVSGGAENQKLIAPNRNDFMRVFVQRSCVQQQRRRLLTAAPGNKLLQRAEFRQGAL